MGFNGDNYLSQNSFNFLELLKMTFQIEYFYAILYNYLGIVMSTQLSKDILEPMNMQISNTTGLKAFF